MNVNPRFINLYFSALKTLLSIYIAGAAFINFIEKGRFSCNYDFTLFTATLYFTFLTFIMAAFTLLNHFQMRNTVAEGTKSISKYTFLFSVLVPFTIFTYALYARWISAHIVHPYIDEYSQINFALKYPVMASSSLQHQAPLDYLFSFLIPKFTAISEFSLRFHAVLFSSLTLVNFYFIFTQLVTNRFLIAIPLALAATETTFIYNSIEGRPPILALFIFTFVIADLLIIIRNPKNRLQDLKSLLTSCLLFLLSTGIQPVVMLITFPIAYYILFFGSPYWKKFKKISTSILISLLLYSPLFAYLVHSAPNRLRPSSNKMAYHIFSNSLAWLTPKYMISPFISYFIFVGVPTIWILKKIRRRELSLELKSFSVILALFLFSYITLFLTFIDWGLFQRYFITSSALIWVVLALTLEEIDRPPYRAIVILTLLVASLNSIETLNSSAEKKKGERLDTWSLLNYIEKYSKSGDYFLFLCFTPAFCEEYTTLNTPEFHGPNLPAKLNTFTVPSNGYWYKFSIDSLQKMKKAYSLDLSNIWLAIDAYTIYGANNDFNTRPNYFPGFVHGFDNIELYRLKKEENTQKEKISESIKKAISLTKQYPIEGLWQVYEYFVIFLWMDNKYYEAREQLKVLKSIHIFDPHQELPDSEEENIKVLEAILTI